MKYVFTVVEEGVGVLGIALISPSFGGIALADGVQRGEGRNPLEQRLGVGTAWALVSVADGRCAEGRQWTVRGDLAPAVPGLDAWLGVSLLAHSWCRRVWAPSQRLAAELTSTV